MIVRILIYMLLTVFTSFYFFPFEFTFIPGINTKMMMAVAGLGFLVFNMINRTRKEMSRDFVILNLLACIVGIISLVSMVYNGTPDNSYMTYIVSVWVWCSAAYAVLNMIHIVHGEVTFRLICNYIIAVCVAQTTLAFSMQFVPALKHFVDSFLAGTGFMGKNEERLYGIGAALDPSGLRFACVLTLTMYLAIHSPSEKKWLPWVYILAYGIIFVFGNMMSRTTIVGVVISLLLLVIELIRRNGVQDEDGSDNLGASGIMKRLLTIILIITPIFVTLYNTNKTVRENLRFGFEGFFALAEEGHWHTSSSDNLESHWVFPETLEAWIIGDGYIASTDIDENYIGVEWAGYYMGTDIGYCRFLFYFGIIGTLAMILFFVYLARYCVRNHPEQEILFMLILLINLIGWCKVSSDVIMVFLPFILFSSTDIDEDSWIED
ncbi:MAG: hypothetical protein KBT08_04335 [Bacteroidales bacterium]|nr:hypothetical protein [Candidatus Cryptobacteroides onthequi]